MNKICCGRCIAPADGMRVQCLQHAHSYSCKVNQYSSMLVGNRHVWCCSIAQVFTTLHGRRHGAMRMTSGCARGAPAEYSAYMSLSNRLFISAQ